MRAAGSLARVLNIAHRGASAAHPENTRPAIVGALSAGADVVEVDIQRTRDGRLVNFHDCTLERATNVTEVFVGREPYRLRDFTLAELRQLDFGGWFDPAHTGEPVLTLAEVLEELDDGLGLLLELSPCGYPGLAADVARELASLPGVLSDRLARGGLVVQSFVLTDAREFHELLPEVPIGLLCPERRPLSDAVLEEVASWVHQINPEHTMVDEVLVKRVHELGMRISPWIVNQPERMRELSGLGVDGLITDRPDLVSELFGSAARPDA